ncbi:hypothetical protein [Bacillus sp. FJAT-45037]|uniref:YqgU-like beta propeller domain-containing protein n=1 Tax=Bacillus sp. FJAT-45037 TaxID=2011007 RepID=UPI000C2504D2|nr:hypothetical protein [Bacillus sp. FJAT-45037]
MRNIIYVLVFLVLLSGCSFFERTSQPLPQTERNYMPKPAVTSSFFNNTTVKPLEDATGFAMVTDWLNDKTILYLNEHDQKSSLMSYHLYNGELKTFFETDEWIVDVKGNEDRSLFSIVTIDAQDRSSLNVVNQEGIMELELRQFGDSYTIYWNPYKSDEFMLVTYLPDWQFEVFHVNVSNQQVTAIEVSQTYFQWLSETEIAYLSWDEFEPNYEAPLEKLDLESMETKKVDQPLISMISFPGHIQVEVSVDSIYELYTMYTFKQEDQLISKLEIPILNTYSETWWVPFHQYDANEGAFYYLRPKYSGDYFSYEDGYELKAYQPKGDSEVTILEVGQHVPLKLSPDGKRMLIGNRLEELILIEEKEKISLLPS